MTAPATATLSPLLTPQGHLLLAPDAEEPSLAAELQRRLADRFALGAGHGLLQLGAVEIATVLPPALAWWRDFAARYVTLLCATPEDADMAVATPEDPLLQGLIDDAPPMRGAEYLSTSVLGALWSVLDAALRSELAASRQALQDFLKARHTAWNLLGDAPKLEAAGIIGRSLALAAGPGSLAGFQHGRHARRRTTRRW